MTVRAYRSSPEALAVAKHYRDRRREAGDCVNHSGRKRTHGCRCFDCYLCHRYGRNWATAYWRPWLRLDLLTAELRLIGAA